MFKQVITMALIKLNSFVVWSVAFLLLVIHQICIRLKKVSLGDYIQATTGKKLIWLDVKIEGKD